MSDAAISAPATKAYNPHDTENDFKNRLMQSLPSSSTAILTAVVALVAGSILLGIHNWAPHDWATMTHAFKAMLNSDIGLVVTAAVGTIATAYLVKKLLKGMDYLFLNNEVKDKLIDPLKKRWEVYTEEKRPVDTLGQRLWIMKWKIALTIGMVVVALGFAGYFGVHDSGMHTFWQDKVTPFGADAWKFIIENRLHIAVAAGVAALGARYLIFPLLKQMGSDAKFLIKGKEEVEEKACSRFTLSKGAKTRLQSVAPTLLLTLALTVTFLACHAIYGVQIDHALNKAYDFVVSDKIYLGLATTLVTTVALFALWRLYKGTDYLFFNGELAKQFAGMGKYYGKVLNNATAWYTTTREVEEHWLKDFGNRCKVYKGVLFLSAVAIILGLGFAGYFGQPMNTFFHDKVVTPFMKDVIDPMMKNDLYFALGTIGGIGLLIGSIWAAYRWLGAFDYVFLNQTGRKVINICRTDNDPRLLVDDVH